MGAESTAVPPEGKDRALRVRDEVAPVVRRLAGEGVIDPSHHVLCYGCGRGADVAWLKVRGFDAVGYDPYPPFGYSTPPEGTHDTVLLVHLMARLKTTENRKATVARAFSHVRPGGQLIIASRSWARLARTAGGATREDAETYLGGLFDGTDAGERAVLPPEEGAEGSICYVARREGIHTPQSPYAWVDDPAEFATICARLRKEPAIGLDVETTLEEPRVLCTVQLGIRGESWIVDTLAITDLAPLKELMEDEGVVKIIHNAHFEEQMLGKHGIRINNVFDTLPASRKKHAKSPIRGSHKLGDVCERELGVYLDKSNQTSDWTRRPLDPDQLAYAAIDAEVLLGLYDVFKPPETPEPMDLFPLDG